MFGVWDPGVGLGAGFTLQKLGAPKASVYSASFETEDGEELGKGLVVLTELE